LFLGLPGDTEKAELKRLEREAASAEWFKSEKSVASQALTSLNFFSPQMLDNASILEFSVE
jgi:hypothetical protein